MPEGQIVSVACSRCQTVLRAPGNFAGRLAKCPRCKTNVRLPEIEVDVYRLKDGSADGDQRLTPARSNACGGALRQAAAGESRARRATTPGVTRRPQGQPLAFGTVDGAGRTVNRQRLAKEILSGFRGSIEPVETPAVYRLMIVVVLAVVMAVLAMYAGLIVVVACGVFYHLTQHIGMISTAHGGLLFVLLGMAYAAPVIAGAILVFFLIKPILARPIERGRTRSVNPKYEPLLYEFVARVCDAVDAPRPKEILIDANINAAAGFRRGAWSMFGDDMTLVIGLPLVAGLSLQEFSGVLAHEFGHFSQGAGMRVSYLIRRVNHWLARVVYERDAWDQWLSKMAAKLDFRFGWILGLAILGVHISRGILWVFMVASHAVAGALLRQMEYDADLHEIRLAGSRTFELTTRRLSLLSVAHQKSLQVMYVMSGRLRYPDDLPALTKYYYRNMPEKLLERIKAAWAEERGSVFASHPTDTQRIARARGQAAPGMFSSRLPANVLFNDFRATSRGVTWDVYCCAFGPQFSMANMCAVEDMIAEV